MHTIITEQYLEKDLEMFRKLKDEAEMNEDFKTFSKYVDLIEDLKHLLKGRYEKQEQMIWHEIHWLLITFTDWIGGEKQLNRSINVNIDIPYEYSILIYERLQYLKKMLADAMEKNKNV